MNNFKGTEFYLGMKVCVAAFVAENPKQREVARISHMLNQSSIPGGVVLTNPLEGFRCWNIDDLVPAKNVRKESKVG